MAGSSTTDCEIQSEDSSFRKMQNMRKNEPNDRVRDVASKKYKFKAAI